MANRPCCVGCFSGDVVVVVVVVDVIAIGLLLGAGRRL